MHAANGERAEAPDDGDDEERPDTDTADLDLLYAPAEGLEGEELRGVLHEIAKRLAPEAGQGQQSAQPDHDNDSWNREHVWPKSHGFPSEGQLAHTDIHHLRPADITCNFDESDVAHPECAPWRDADSFEPRDAVKGDVARMLFYMDVRYAGDDGVPDLALIDQDSNSGPLLGHLCTLLAWNSADPVDDLERQRHQRIVETQGNRNPFVDRPEFAATIWANACA